jgi:hypothetical protein
MTFSQKSKTLGGRSTTSPRAWFHYLPLFAANRLVICRYWPLIEFHLPLVAAIFRYQFPLSIAAICR